MVRVNLRLILNHVIIANHLNKLYSLGRLLRALKRGHIHGTKGGQAKRGLFYVESSRKPNS